MRLGEICQKIGSGATPTGGKNSYADSGISLIRSQNVLDFAFSYNGLAHINEEQADKLRNVNVLPDDVLLNITGDSVARVCMVDEAALPARVNQHVAIVRVDKTLADPYYVMLWLVWQKNRLLSLASNGATRHALTKEMIQELDLSLPSLNAQTRVSRLLHSLDRKIALNRRKIATLEKMAKEIYDYWFVQYDFPDANGRPYKSSGGEMVYSPELKREIPKGWKVEQLKDVLKVCNGKDHKSLKDGTIPVYGSGGVMRCVDTVMYSQPSVLIPRKGTLNNIIYARKPFWCVDTIFYTTSTVSNFTKYLYYSIRDMDFMSLNTGTAVPSMTAGVIGLIAIPMPTLGLLESFDKTLEHLFLSRDSAQDEVDRLITLRDFLLPLLMNGQVKVGE